MSDGLKTALILGGAAVAGFLIWKNSQPTVANLTGAGSGTTSTTSTAPGAPASPAPAAVVGAIPQQVGSTSSGGSSALSTIKSVGLLAAAPVIVPTVLTVKAGKAVASGVVSVGKSVGSAVSSVGHALSSIF